MKGLKSSIFNYTSDQQDTELEDFTVKILFNLCNEFREYILIDQVFEILNILSTSTKASFQNGHPHRRGQIHYPPAMESRR